MKNKIIEMVCTANQGRSPAAELITRNYLRRIGALGEYEAASSGTLVDCIQNERFSDEYMINMIEAGKQRRLYFLMEMQEIEEAIRNGDSRTLKKYFWKTANTFSKEEHKHRAEALKYFGIKGIVKKTSEQTTVRPDMIAVLSMAESNNKKVQEIYDGSGYNPVIDVISRYATQNPEAGLPDAFGKGKEKYFKVIEVLLEHIPMAVDRLIENG
jgi:protein-tyrosine-phosphatase